MRGVTIIHTQEIEGGDEDVGGRGITILLACD